MSAYSEVKRMVGDVLTNYSTPGQHSRNAKEVLMYQPEYIREWTNSFWNLLGYKEMSVRRRVAMENKDKASFEISRNAGFAVLEPGKFKEADELIDFANNLTDGIDENEVFEKAKTINKEFSGSYGAKSYRINKFVDERTLDLDSPFLKLALREDILATVSQYFGFVPVIEYVDIWYSRNTNADKPYGSQLWHCDILDITNMRIFAFCSDITIENGPLTAISADKSKEIRDELDYTWGTRVSDEEMEAHVSDEEIVKAAGPKGTLLFADAGRCFHYGSRVNDKPRIIAMVRYVPPFSCNVAMPFKHLVNPDLSEMQRLALGGK